MNKDLKVFYIGIEFSYDVYGGLFGKKFKYSDSYIDYNKIIIAKNLDKAKETYLSRYRFDESLFHPLSLNNCLHRLTKMELVNLKTDHINFEYLKQKANHNEFLEYIKQELCLDDQIIEVAK